MIVYFINEFQNEFGKLFVEKDIIDFTQNKEVKKKIYDFMVKILKFDLKKLTKTNDNNS